MSEKKHVHVIGLCGVGMSATALLLKEAGWSVTGSDAECYGPPKEILRRGGLELNIPYSPSNIPPQVDEFIIGRSAKVTAETNEEVRAAQDTKKPIYSFPQILGSITEGRDNVVVAGSYGKSTTTSLIAHILCASGVDAGYFIGAEPISLPLPSSLGTHAVFVLEGDEYPSAHDDAHAKFMHFHPRDVVLTAVVHDHVHVYPTYKDYQKPCRDLLALVPENGLVLVSEEEHGAVSLARESGKKIVTYGVDQGDFHVKNIVYGAHTTFTLIGPNALELPLTMQIIGRHNIENVVAACAYVLSRTLTTPDKLQGAVASFSGVRRKLDNIAPQSRVPVYEGFGSSYEKARSAIDAIRLHFPQRRLVIVFEAHTFGWRNRANLSWYDDVFAGSELVFIAPPETQGAGTHDQLSFEDIFAQVSTTGVATLPYHAKHPDEVVTALEENDVLLILTSGSLEDSLPQLTDSVEKRFS